MAFDWRPFPELLSEIVDNRGRTCPVGEVGLPLIATNCIKPDRLFPVYETDRYVSQHTYDHWFRGHPLPGDILFVCKGSPGRTSWVPDPVDFCIAQDMVAVRPNPDRVYAKYLLAALRSQSVQHQIATMHVGTLIPHFKKGDFGKLLIPVPDDATQQLIGDFYFALSLRIEHNRALAANLEAIARALFKSWFVDFDPVRAKAAGEASPGLAPDLAALFPDRFMDSELEEIPEGWSMRTIADLAEVVGGSTPSTKSDDYWIEGQHHWATPKDLAALSSPVLLGTERKVTDAGLDQISSGLLPPGTVLLSSRAPIGYLAIAAVPVAINQGFIAMKPKVGVSNLYLLYWAETSHEAIVANANGSTFLEISKKNFRPIPAIDPGADVMAAFDSVVAPVFDRIVCAQREVATLIKLRDLLLPRLISGKLRVEDAEAALEAA